MSRRLVDLHPHFRPLAVELLACLVEERIVVIVVDTLRTNEEHQENLRKGVSWTTQSLHLFGLAIDVAPLAIYELYGGNKVEWNAADPVWQKMGEIGERIGLDWGGRWTSVKPDMGHFEHPRGRYLSQLK